MKEFMYTDNLEWAECEVGDVVRMWCPMEFTDRTEIAEGIVTITSKRWEGYWIIYANGWWMKTTNRQQTLKFSEPDYYMEFV